MIRRLAFRDLGAGWASPIDTAASFSLFRCRLGVSRADGGQLFVIQAPVACLQMIRRLAFRGLGAGQMNPNDTAASFS